MKLNEVVMPSNDQMTTTQQTALLSVFIAMSNSPEAGAEALKGSEQKMAAGEYLIHKGYVAVNQQGIGITREGLNLLITSGLIQNNVVTPKGQALINPAQPQQQKAAPAPQPQGIT
jgi:hypothetical protein